MGPPSWIRSDVKNAKVGPLLLILGIFLKVKVQNLEFHTFFGVIPDIFWGKSEPVDVSKN